MASDLARQVDEVHGGHDADVDLWIAPLHAVGRHDQVARDGPRSARSEGVTGDRRDRRLAHPVLRPVHLEVEHLDELSQAAAVEPARHLQVHAGAEHRVEGAAQDDRAHLRVLPGEHLGIDHLPGELHRDRVHQWAIHGDPGHLVADSVLGELELGHGLILSAPVEESSP